MTYGIAVTVERPFADAVQAVRTAPAAQGFGVLTEIDVPPQVILGACNPPLAHRALQAEGDIGLLRPCNVVVRAGDDGRTVVTALDPDAMVGLTGNEGLRPVADDAGARLRAALDYLTGD